MSTSTPVPDPGLAARPAQDDLTRPAADGRAEPPVAETSRWADAVKPLPEILKQLEKRKLMVTILLFGFLALKVIVAAKGDIPTALGIFQTTNPAITAIGALMSGLPLGAVAFLIVVGYRAAREASWEGYVLAVIAALACFFVTPWPILAACLVVAPVAGYAMRHRRRLTQAQGKRWQKRGTLLILIPCLAVFLYIACVTSWRVMYDVWLPHEAVTLQSGRVEVGYVLNDNGNWISILRSGQRRLVRYRETQVEKRVLCQLHAHGVLADLTAWRALGPHAWTAAGEPDCPLGFRGNP
ncbi:MAG TPA: hypothetical protein VEC76_17795 [Streptosporangiaceae bacterium]|nr:hypothetical protein [Streptosporangiaceae bacterium]